MKCKNCGGEIRFCKGEGVCCSCGVSFVVDGIYENTEVYICYKESDDAGRRTKDSIIAQEVYNKLESSNINTFYERISADGKIEDDLEESKYSAISKAKAVLVVGTSKEIFAELEKKYGEVFFGKKVIPFCVDVNPGDIPKSLSSIQAINYSSIGWEKDLINGLYNLLGKEKSDFNSFYSKKHRKTAIIVTLLSVLVLVSSAFCLLWYSVLSDESKKTDPTSEETVKTQQQIYDEAEDLYNQGKFKEALVLLSTISQRSDSVNLQNRIYSKYEGYYEKSNINIYFVIKDNVAADIEVTISKDDSLVRISESTNILLDTINFDYLDNFNQTGNIDIKLENTGLKLIYSADKKDSVETDFTWDDKVDKPVLHIEGETLLKWLENDYSIAQVKAAGYELEAGYVDPTQINRYYKIKDAEIYLWGLTSTSVVDELDEVYLFEIATYAQTIAPSLVGKEAKVSIQGDLTYWPGGYFATEPYLSDTERENISQIAEKTIVGVISKNDKQIYLSEVWDCFIEDRNKKTAVSMGNDTK